MIADVSRQSRELPQPQLSQPNSSGAAPVRIAGKQTVDDGAGKVQGARWTTGQLVRPKAADLGPVERTKVWCLWVSAPGKCTEGRDASISLSKRHEDPMMQSQRER